MIKFLSRCRYAAQELRVRGPLNCSLLVARELLSPLMYWHVLHVFEKNVDPPQPDSSAEFNVAVYGGRDNLEEITRELAPMGEISAEEIKFRLSSGDAVAVAYAGSDPAGYSWVRFATGLEVAFRTLWILGPKQAVFYGSFTHPQWRGRGVQSHLDASMMCYLARHGIATVFATVSALNRPMLRATKSSQRRKIMTLALVRVHGLHWVYRRSFGAPLGSRFAVSVEEAGHDLPHGNKART